jgi:predicted AlkP superfamily phosphohydrolase/phosphomutase
MVMSDHGMGPFYKWINLNVWLLRQGYLKLKRNMFVKIKKALFDIGITPSAIYKILLAVGFSKANVSFEARDRLITRLFLSWNDVDWQRTKAYSRGHIGQIFINKKGREPGGIVAEEQYHSLKEEIQSKLMHLKDKDIPVVERIIEPDEAYSGPYRKMSADILFMPRHLEYIALGTSAFISKRVLESCFGSTGNHRMNGIFSIKGKGIKKNFKIQGAGIVDVVPNLLFYFGLPVDKEMDGKVLSETFEPDFLASREIIYKDMGAIQEREGADIYSHDEAESIRNALKDLGYLG